MVDKSLSENVLFTDMYQLTMAQLYFRMGLHEKIAQFDHFFRQYPDYGSHKAGYCINAGLDWFLNWMEESKFDQKTINYLRTLETNTGKQLFHEDFLEWLYKYGEFSALTIYAPSEGRVIHPNTPQTIVQGPIIFAQLVETSLLNHINYQTLIATKASRIHEIGQGKMLLEFGLRRAHWKGGNAGTRAALIGGADFSSNVGESAVLGYPPKGTHAHSMIQLFLTLGMTELDAFLAYADVFPDDCILLVDTINTLESGIPNAIRVFEKLSSKGHRPVGIRIDSGDLAYLSIQSAKLLDEAGFRDVSIVLSNDLDEMVIWQILTQITEEAPRYGLKPDDVIDRLVYGVGTKLITSWGESSLGGVYKLVAVQDGHEWQSAMKISESPLKTPNPGRKQVWRIYDKRGKASVDCVCLEEENPETNEMIVLRHPNDRSKYRILRQKEISDIEPLLIKVYSDGHRVGDVPTIEDMRELRENDINRLDAGVKRIINPHIYHISLSQKLWDLKQDLIKRLRGDVSSHIES